MEPQVGLKTDPHYVHWVGASCVAKVQCAEELFVPCDKIKPKFLNYNQHAAAVQQSVRTEFKGQENFTEVEIEREVQKRIKRERACMAEGGMRLVCEKATFTF